MRGGRKSERLREREIDWERKDRSGWRQRWPNRRSVVATRLASALESLVEQGLRSIVKIGAQPVLVDAWLAIGEVGLGCLWIGDEGGVESIFA